MVNKNKQTKWYTLIGINDLYKKFSLEKVNSNKLQKKFLIRNALSFYLGKRGLPRKQHWLEFEKGAEKIELSNACNVSNLVKLLHHCNAISS